MPSFGILAIKADSSYSWIGKSKWAGMINEIRGHLAHPANDRIPIGVKVISRPPFVLRARVQEIRRRLGRYKWVKRPRLGDSTDKGSVPCVGSLEREVREAPYGRLPSNYFDFYLILLPNS